MGDTLLVTGGVGRQGILKAINRFTTFNIRTNVWSEGPPMMDARKCHGAAVLDSKLYVMGGSDQQLSVLDGKLYVMGGSDQQLSLMVNCM